MKATKVPMSLEKRLDICATLLAIAGVLAWVSVTTYYGVTVSPKFFFLTAIICLTAVPAQAIDSYRRMKKIKAMN